MKTKLAFYFSFFCILIFSCKKSSPPSNYLNVYSDIEYVGVNTCKQCHLDIYNTFSQTGMGKSFNLAKKQFSSAVFDLPIYDSILNFHYFPYWSKKGNLILNEYQLKSEDTVFSFKRDVDFIIGSGHHTNSHIISNNGYLFQAPFTFYTQDSILDFPPGFENGRNSRFDRKIGLECMTCHNAFPHFVLGSENKFESLPNGIDCERCHGPGKLHVSNIQSGMLIDTSKFFDYSIVNPINLSIELQNELCSRCHIQGNSVLKYDKSFFDFKPGMYLNEVMDVYLPRYTNSDDEFIMASHLDRMKQSKCFIKSDGNMTCLGCHNPHISVKKTNVLNYNNSCFSCHNNDECSEIQEERMIMENNCVSCHMRESKTIDIPHVTITDHKIKINRETSLNSGNKFFLGLECVNNDSPSNYSIVNAYLQEYDSFSKKDQYLDSAFFYLEKMDFNTKEGLFSFIFFHFLSNSFDVIVEKVNEKGIQVVLSIFNNTQFNNFDATTCYRIGQSFYRKGDYSNANIFLKQSVDLAPFHLDFLEKYGINLIQLNQFENAKKQFQFIINEDPRYFSAYNHLGNLYIHDYLTKKDERDKNLASYYFDISLNLNPNYEQGLLNKTRIHILENDFISAKKILKKIKTLYPQNEYADTLLNQINEKK